MTDTPARSAQPADVPGRAEAAQREPSLHDEAVDIAQQWLRFTEHGAPPHVLASAPHRYIVGVLEAFPAMRAALEDTEAGLRVVMSETFDRDEATTLALGRLADELAAVLRAVEQP